MKLLALKHQSPNMKSAFLPLSQLCEMQKKTKLPFFLSYLDLGYIFRRVFDLWNPDIYIYILELPLFTSILLYCFLNQTKIGSACFFKAF